MCIFKNKIFIRVTSRGVTSTWLRRVIRKNISDKKVCNFLLVQV
jgi:hypothetical protein